jgi:hypothetical protein
MAKSPIPLLVAERGMKLPAINALCARPQSIAQLHGLAKKQDIPNALHKRFFITAMQHWGMMSPSPARTLLWKCYFRSPPTVLHLLFFVHEVPEFRLLNATGWTSRLLDKLLRRPKMQQKHLRKLAPFAIKYIETLRSRRQIGGPDMRWVDIDEALKDPSRMYKPGTIMVD